MVPGTTVIRVTTESLIFVQPLLNNGVIGDMLNNATIRDPAVRTVIISALSNIRRQLKICVPFNVKASIRAVMSAFASTSRTLSITTTQDPDQDTIENHAYIYPLTRREA